MGGRGSKSKIKQIIESPKNKKLNLGDYFKDKETTRQNELTKTLKNYNIIVCESTDTMDEHLLKSNLKQIEKLSKRYSSLLSKEPEQELHIRNQDLKDVFTNACFVRQEPSFAELQICYNKKTIGNLEENNEKVKKLMQIGWSAKADNVTDYIITHEFGHYLERNIIEKRLQKDIRQYVNFKNDYKNSIIRINHEADMISEEILKIAKTKYKNNDWEISKYGKQDSREWFAEVFVSAYANDTNKPPLAKAMIDFLEKEIKSNVHTKTTILHNK